MCVYSSGSSKGPQLVRKGFGGAVTVRHLPLSGQLSGLLQLHLRGSSAGAGVRISALWLLMMVAMLPIQL